MSAAAGGPVLLLGHHSPAFTRCTATAEVRRGAGGVYEVRRLGIVDLMRSALGARGYIEGAL